LLLMLLGPACGRRVQQGKLPALAGSGRSASILSAQRSPHPPFKKLWGLEREEQVESFVISGGAIYFGAWGLRGAAYGAADLATGRRLWVKTVPDKSGTNVADDGKALFVSIGEWKLLACDPRTGKQRWSMPLKGFGSPMAARGGLLFCQLQDGVMSAIDTRTHKPRWTCRLSQKPLTWTCGGKAATGISAVPLFAGGRMFVGTYGAEVLCLHPQTGRVQWRHAAKQTGQEKSVTGIVADGGRVYFATDLGEVEALDINSGKRLWRFAAQAETWCPPALVGGLVVLTGPFDGMVWAINKSDGRQRWSRRVSKVMHPDVSPPSAHGGRIFVTAESKLFAFDATGKRLWTWDTEDDRNPCLAAVLKDGVLLEGGEGYSLARFVMGKPPGLPCDVATRRALARKLVARFDRLNADEKRTLRKLGDDAFEPLLALAKERLKDYEGRKAKTGERYDEETDNAYSRFYDAMELLPQVATRKRTPELLLLLQIAKTPDGRGPVLQCLVGKGDERQTMPLFISILKKVKPDWGYAYSQTSLALYAVARSRDPRAVEFMLEQLANPRAAPEIRGSAFLNLARTGGSEGLKAVLAAKDRRRMIPSFAEFMRLDKLGTTVEKPVKPSRSHYVPSVHLQLETQLAATRKDKDGVLWGLITSAALGAGDDLWIVKHDGEHWTEPVFTGVSRGELGKQDWFSRFVGNATLSRDSDGDGWTDLVEERLGADPHNPDTDGDGIKDSQDKNPLAAPRSLSQEEQVLAAAFEARYRFVGDRDVPCLVTLPKGIEPLELSGWNWTIIPEKGARKSPLSKVIQKGAAAVDFMLPSCDFSGAALLGRKPGELPFVLWNKDHTQAKLELETYYAGLDATGFDITLKRFGRDWVVIRAEMTWIS
jgi:outer membrane protein assembly factor BamB